MFGEINLPVENRKKTNKKKPTKKAIVGNVPENR